MDAWLPRRLHREISRFASWLESPTQRWSARCHARDARRTTRHTRDSLVVARSRCSSLSTSIDEFVVPVDAYIRRYNEARIKSSADPASKAITEATDRGFSHLSNITLHEFMYAVKLSFTIDGVSELDTLLRLLTIEQRDALPSDVAVSAPLRTAIERIRDIPLEIRKVSLLHMNCANEEPSPPSRRSPSRACRSLEVSRTS